MNSCDTMVALPGSTAGGQTIFAKNSDRPADECQPLVLRPAATHASGSVANCQFVNVEQAPVTYRHVGSRPWWCYGYEHGFNEHQVVIGNESLPSRLGHAPDARLVGMEVLRLALERARTAGEAVEVITGMVSRYGQGKFDNTDGVRTYDNIYLVADPREAYVVEAVCHEWAVKRVMGSVRSQTSGRWATMPTAFQSRRRSSLKVWVCGILQARGRSVSQVRLPTPKVRRAVSPGSAGRRRCSASGMAA